MLNIKIICVGKLKEKYWKEAVSEYSKRLNAYCKLTINEVRDEKISGGSLGIGKEVLDRADEKMSFSKLTFPHQMIRTILLEQIYRAFKISRGEVYHK